MLWKFTNVDGRFTIAKKFVAVQAVSWPERLQQKEHEYLFWDYGHARKTYIAALRTGEWKGVNIGTFPMELYNLEKDPDEVVNLAQNHPEIVRRIESLMKKARSQTDDYPMRKL